MANASRHGSLLESFHQKIVENLDVKSLLPILIANGVLCSSEIDQLTDDKTNKTKAELLCSILVPRGPHTFNQFVSALREDGQERHRELARILARAKNNINWAPSASGANISSSEIQRTPAEVHGNRETNENRMVEHNEDVNILSRIELLDQQLGRGAYGRVFAVKHRGTTFAAKEIHSTLMQHANAEERQKVLKQFIEQCKLSMRLTHPNIVKLIGLYYPKQHSLPVTIMEFMDCSLTDYLKEHSSVNSSVEISILHDLCMGLNYCHSKNPPVVHHGISSDNILLKFTGGIVLPIVKISNLSIAAMMLSSNKQHSQFPETAAFMPPEAFEASIDPHEFSTSLDVFSVGCVAIHTLTHKCPTPLMEIHGKIITEVERRQKYLDMITGEVVILKPVIKACLNDDPKGRPTVEVLLKNIVQLMRTSQTISKSINEGREMNIDAILRKAEALVDSYKEQMDAASEVSGEDETSDNDHSMSMQEGSSDEDSPVVSQCPTRLEMEQAKEKKQHTVHYFLHFSEGKCNLCGTPKECQNLYDEKFAYKFQQFLDRGTDNSLASANKEDIPPGDNFLSYIETHLRANKCPSFCSKLWKYCLNNKLYGSMKYAPEGLLIYSNTRQSAVGTVTKTYSEYRDEQVIGHGGFGKVYVCSYKYSDKMAVKEEFKRPLVAGNSKLFQRIMQLNHPNVIKVLEYVAGPCEKEGNRKFLSVMPFKNQKDLQKQFTKDTRLTCVLDYMQESQYQKNFIFRNYTVLLQHVFEGLCYLKSQRVVHRDIKDSNILVHQNCVCQSPLQCTCTGDGHVTYLLGYMNLAILEEESPNLTCTWGMARHTPAGTMGMTSPELFFRTDKGEQMVSHKSDVWSLCATMVKVLVGKAVHTEAQEEISKFVSLIDGTKALTECSNQPMAKLLDNEGERLHCSRIYKKESPLAEILTIVYAANTLHWKCLSKLPHIFNTQLWTVIQKALDVIIAGIKLAPDKRPDATTIVNLLEAIPPVDCAASE